MLQFLVFDDNGLARDFSLANAHLIGRDELPFRAEISFRDGRIRCRRRGDDPAALSLLWDAGSMGRLMLQTCLLPDREAPYVLSLELARNRIRQFIAKSEDWQMFDLSHEHSAMRRWEEARALFTEAMNERDPLRADRHARASVECAVDASERLALAHAEVLLHRRFGTRAAAATVLGLGVWPPSFEAAQQAVVQREADIVAIPLPWRAMEVAEGRYDWERTDRAMAWAHQQGKPIVAGPLLDFSPGAVPPWVDVWKHDFDTCRDLAYDHLAKVVERYRNVATIWNLAAGLNLNDHFSFTADQMVALVRTAGVLVRQMRRGAKTMIELVQPFGEHVAFQRESIAPMAWLDRLVQEGLQIDSIGVRVEFGAPRRGGEARSGSSSSSPAASAPRLADSTAGAGASSGERGGTTIAAANGLAARDLMQISALLDRLLPFETHVMVTGMAVPALPVDDRSCGHWHEGWSPATQSEWVSRVFPVAMSKPFIDAVLWGSVSDHPGQSVPGSGLLGPGGEPRPVAGKLFSMRRRLKKPLGLLRAQRSTVLGESE